MENYQDSTSQYRKALCEDLASISFINKMTWIATYPQIEASMTKEAIEDFIHTTPEQEEERFNICKTSHEDERWNLWVACNKEKVVGYCNIIRISESSFEIQSLYLLPNHHSKGIGTELLKYAIDSLPPKSIVLVRTLASNRRAQAFYEKNKFVRQDVLVEPFLFKGKPIPQISLLFTKP